MHPFGLGSGPQAPQAARNSQQHNDTQDLSALLGNLNLSNTASQARQGQDAPALGGQNQLLSLREAVHLYIQQAYGTGMEPWDSARLEQYLGQIIEQSMIQVQQTHPESFSTNPPSQAPQHHSDAREA